MEVRRFDDEIGTVSLDPNQRTTVVVCPYSTCAQVPGTQFSFGGSFVLPSAVSQLSGIARILQGAAMRTALIYGHTDRAGNDLLNKQLSERRAKAVYAVLRHDTEAWEELWSGTRDVDPWYEHWGTTEGQIMLNALGARDAEGNPLDEDGKAGPCTRAAIQRFQRGDYPKRPAEQAPLPESGTLDAATRRELFLANAKLVSRQPLDPSCFAQVDGSAFMGCGEFNPMSLSAEDAESRRVTADLRARGGAAGFALSPGQPVPVPGAMRSGTRDGGGRRSRRRASLSVPRLSKPRARVPECRRCRADP